MAEIRFKDSMREYIKIFIILFCVLAVATTFVILNFVKEYNGKNTDISQILPLIPISIALIFALIYFAYICTYQVVVRDGTIIVTVFGFKKIFALNQGVHYSYKQMNSTKYYRFSVRIEDKKINVTTKKPKEFVDILLEYNAKLVQNI